MSDGLLEVEVLCPDADCAEQIGVALVAERLAACINVHGGVRSCYHWQGGVETATEVPLVVKTRAALFDALCARVVELHPYDVPCVIGRDLPGVLPAYAAWVVAETGGA